MDRLVGAELGQAQQGVRHIPLLEQRLELVAEPRGREIADEAHLDGRAREPFGVGVHAEAEPVLVADRPEDAGRVVDEGEVVEHADRARLEVSATAEGIDESAEVLALKRSGHRVDREVTAAQVFVDRRMLHGRERRRRVVELGARRDEVDVLAVAVADDRSAELLVRRDSAVELGGQASREGDRVALHRDVDVEAGLAEQDVPHRAADQVDAVVRLRDGGDGFEHVAERQCAQLLQQALARFLALLGRLAERAQEVAARDDADDVAVALDGDAAVG